MADDVDMTENYKELQEQFVSNLNGTSLLEISIIVSSAPTAVILRTIVVNLSLLKAAKLNKVLYCCMFCLADNLTLILPVFLAFTVLADHINTLLVTCVCLPSGFLLWNTQREQHKSRSEIAANILKTDMSEKRPFIGNFRAYVLIATAIAILAVDFTIFPRRFAKAETYGSGLMDVGVGAFVISNAIVSPEARGISPRNGSSISAVVRSIKSSLPLIFLGVIRFIAVKSTDYQEHVNEYGIHWNFFFTLFVVRVFSPVFVQLIPGSKWFGVSGLTLACLYQYLLSCTGLRQFILYGRQGDGSRHGLIDANREGIFSCIGYLSLYLIGVQLGTFIFHKRDTLGKWLKFLFILVILDILFWILVQASQYFISPVSRRMANLSFVLWQVAYNIQLLSSFLLCDILVTIANNTGFLQSAQAAGCPVCYPDKLLDTEHTSSSAKHSENRPCACLIAAINRNQLVYFLLANLLTGLVNFLVQTLFCSALKGFIIVSCYLFVLNSVMLILHLFRRTLKFK